MKRHLINKITFILLIIIIVEKVLAQNYMLPEKKLKEIDNYLTNVDTINIEYFDSLLLSYPYDDYIVGMKAYSLYFKEKKQEAQLFLSEALNKETKLKYGTFINLSLGIIALDDDNDSSLSYFTKSIEYDTDMVNKWVRLELFYYYKETDYDKAFKYLSEALRIDANFTSAQMEMSNILQSEGKIDSALNILDDVIERAHNFNAYCQKALLLLDIGSYENAKKCFLLSNEKKKNVESLIGLGYIEQYQNKNYELAKQYYENANQLDINHPVPYKRMGLFYLDLDRLDSSKMYLEKALKLSPILDNYLELIYVNTLLEDYSNAKYLLNDALSKYNHEYELDFWKILLLSLAENKNEAQESINEFYNKYTDIEINWLKSELKVWNINIK
ncbi:MAG: hypothetical protein A2033_18735 [Bacteroidetes bacterium GWA2_31_9]|nr:MAG: hypothetical protein A2033_18735 [Bacteroidetes bacterium GWA2_31_9]